MASTPFPSRPVGPKGPKGNFGPAISVKVEGIKNLTDLAQKFNVDLEDAISESLKSIGVHLAVHAKDNAPIKTGDLRDSIHPDNVRKSKGYFTIAIIADVPYAAEMHEYLIKTISNAPLYQLGERSREYDAMYTGNEGGVGGGYIIRVLNAYAPAYLQLIKNNITTALLSDARTAALVAPDAPSPVVQVPKGQTDPLRLRIRGRGGARVRKVR